MTFQKVLVALSCLALLNAQDLAPEPVVEVSAMNATDSPIQKVVTLLTEMKQQVSKDGENDDSAYDKYMCWCETNEKEKTEAIKAAEEKIDSLSFFIEEASAKEAELKTAIEALEKDIAEDKEDLATATALREKEHVEFQETEAELKESSEALAKAVAVLSKVQLVQKPGAMTSGTEEQAALIQVRNIVQAQKFHRYPHFKSVMQKDLFDVLGSFEDETVAKRPALQANIVMGEAFLPKREAAALQQTADKLLPWEKSDEEAGMDAKPNDLSGAAAGAKSYNSRSGSIYGMLQQMLETFQKDLATAQKEEAEAQASYKKLSEAKLEEIRAATEMMNAKEAELSELIAKKAAAKEDLEATQKAMAADQEFLVNMKKGCKVVDEDYKKRVETRSQEIQALSETLEILTADESRDLFTKSLSFLQQSSHQHARSRRSALRHAMKHLAKVARKNHDMALVSFAMRANLDSFSKVKEMMDKMKAELQAQQKAEYEKHEFCKKEIDEVEDKIKEEEHKKDDLAEKHLALENALKVLADDVSKLKAEVAEMEASLKKAGIDRHAENKLYQAEVADQRATVNILKLAYERLKKFYAPSMDGTVPGMLMQVQKHGFQQEPPPMPGYSKHGSAGGALQLIATIIQDAEVEEQELVQGEQRSQEVYSVFVQDTTKSIEADREAIAEKEQQAAATSEELSETKEAQIANEAQLEKANDLLKATHLECDFLLKYFNVRQKARAEEIESIDEAHAILSGANFGTES